MEPSTEPSNTSNQARCCMLVLCGIPGSGKSTVSAALAAAAEASGTAVTSINFDTHSAGYFREEKEPSPNRIEDFNPEKWKADRAASLHAVSQALVSFTNPLNKNSDSGTRTTPTSTTTCSNKKHLVIVDDTMHYRSMRAECWHIARTTGAAYLYAHIKCPLELASKRNSKRPPGQRVPENVLKRTAAIFEPPEENDSQGGSYDSDKYRIVLGTEVQLLEDPPEEENTGCSSTRKIRGIDGEALWARVQAAWGRPAPAPFDEEAEEARISLARKGTAESLLHQVDVQTRKYLTEILSEFNQKQGSCSRGGGGDAAAVPKEEKKKLAEELNKERRYVLENFRSEVLKNEYKEEILSVCAKGIVEAFEKRCREYVAHRESI